MNAAAGRAQAPEQRRRLFSQVAELAPLLGIAFDAPPVLDPTPGRLQDLARMFVLGPFEQRLVLWCAAVELDAGFPAPSFGRALAVLPDPDWQALSPLAALRRWRIVEPLGDGGLMHAPLRLDERVLLWLLGLPAVDERLAVLVDRIEPSGESQGLEPLLRQMADAWHTRETVPVLRADSFDRPSLAAAAHALGLGLLRIRLDGLPARADERDGLRRLLEREAVLTRSAILATGEPAPEMLAAASAFLDRLQGFIACEGGAPVLERPVRQVVLPDLGFAGRVGVWRRSLGPAADGLHAALDAVADQFRLDEAAIAAAARTLPPEPGREALWDAGRRATRLDLGQLATRIAPRARFEDLVLPEAQVLTLRMIAAHVRRRSQVQEGWGFGDGPAAARGLIALFAGPSGTGKTMAAEVLAHDLALDLWRIDLATLVSKWVGGTEKNLKRVFDAADRGGAILLFDEADALFGRRSEVRDSHDRYANIEVGYLLQRLEAFEGLAILTTNQKESMDSAFLRRFRFVLHLSLPDREQRAELWRRAFPPRAPLGVLDFDRLARLPLSGGNIRTMALNAAFLAAEEDLPIAMHHLRDAARAEYAKLERPSAELDAGGFA